MILGVETDQDPSILSSDRPLSTKKSLTRNQPVYATVAHIKEDIYRQ